MKYSTALCGKSDFSSPYSCAASVLLCDITSVGLPYSAITWAIVNVLPVPVAPMKHLRMVSSAQPLGELHDRLGLVAGGVVGRYEIEGGHGRGVVALAAVPSRSGGDTVLPIAWRSTLMCQGDNDDPVAHWSDR